MWEMKKDSNIMKYLLYVFCLGGVDFVQGQGITIIGLVFIFLCIFIHRYKRRGVDEDGEVANYVETEQIIIYRSHEVSFMQVRGSVPVFWSQPGYKYRPPPRLDKGKFYWLF